MSGYVWALTSLVPSGSLTGKRMFCLPLHWQSACSLVFTDIPGAWGSVPLSDVDICNIFRPLSVLQLSRCVPPVRQCWKYPVTKKIKNTRAGVCITQETASWDSVLWTFVKLLIPTSVVCLSLPIGDEHLPQWQGHPKNQGGPRSEPDCHLQRQQPAGRRYHDHQCFLWYACLQHNSLNQIRTVCSQHYSNLETISFLGCFFLMILGNQPNPDYLNRPCTNQLSVFRLGFFFFFCSSAL